MSNKIKKAYEGIIALLELNKEETVASIFDQVVEMASSKTNRSEGSTFLKDDEGNVVAIYDYYFKRWMPLIGDLAVDFGAKAGTSTGLNTMCKEGVSNWTKQNSKAKKAKGDLLDKVSSGEVDPADIKALQAEIETARLAIMETELGFTSKEDLIEYLMDLEIALAA